MQAKILHWLRSTDLDQMLENWTTLSTSIMTTIKQVGVPGPNVG